MNYPVLSDNIQEKKVENKNNLLYLKKLFEEEKVEEHPKKIFVPNDKEYFNHLDEKKRNTIDMQKKYMFLRGKKKYILIKGK